MTMTDPATTRVLTWWSILSVIGVFNLAVWIVLTIRWRRRRAAGDDELPAGRKWQVLFSGLFVAGCAFRSFLPRVEAQRFCLLDSWWSNATLGRSVATVAELAFVAQWAWLLREWCETARAPVGVRASRLLVPLITLAEIFSWYTTLTTNFIGSVLEESLWALTGAAVLVTLGSLWLRYHGPRQRFMGVALVLNAIYVLFMCTVDVPMYLRRWREDEAAGRRYLTVGEGWRDASSRWIVTRRWADWREEVPWMSLYFSAGAWLSLSLARAPRFAGRDDEDRS